jgi:hypothetical protein
MGSIRSCSRSRSIAFTGSWRTNDLFPRSLWVGPARRSGSVNRSSAHLAPIRHGRIRRSDRRPRCCLPTTESHARSPPAHKPPVVGAGQRYRDPFCEGWRLWTEVYHDVVNRASRASYQLRLAMRRGLIVHAAQGSLAWAKGKYCTGRGPDSAPWIRTRCGTRCARRSPARSGVISISQTPQIVGLIASPAGASDSDDSFQAMRFGLWPCRAGSA